MQINQKSKFKQSYLASFSASRKANALEKCLVRHEKKTFAARIKTLRADIQASISGELRVMRETDNFIASGKSLFVFIRESRDNAILARREARLMIPPLPTGLKLPPNSGAKAVETLFQD